jgi:predicted acetyltransferase
MQIKEIPDDEIDRRFYLGSQAFMYGSRDNSHYHDPNRMPSDNIGIYDDVGLQAKIHVIPFRSHFGPDVVLSMGGIAGVACLPASRGKGYINAGMTFTLERMREKGQLISVLYPFAYDFYRRLGWEWTGERREYHVPTSILKPDPATEQVRAALPADRSAIIDCYTRYSIRYRGMTQREERLWNRILNDSKDRFTYTYLYEENGRVEGYVAYRGGNSEETELADFICLTPRALRGLLGLLRRLDMQVDKFAWAVPGDDLLWSQLTHQKIETKVSPFAQSRVVDAPAALEAWHPAAHLHGRVTISLHDEHAPWNTGTWQLDYEAGHVRVTAANRDPQVSLDIQALTQAYFGTPNLDYIRRAERLAVHDEAGYAALGELLSGPPMAIFDGF